MTNEKPLELSTLQEAIERYDNSLANVAKSGDYNDLINTPGGGSSNQFIEQPNVHKFSIGGYSPDYDSSGNHSGTYKTLDAFSPNKMIDFILACQDNGFPTEIDISDDGSTLETVIGTIDISINGTNYTGKAITRYTETSEPGYGDIKNYEYEIIVGENTYQNYPYHIACITLLKKEWEDYEFVPSWLNTGPDFDLTGGTGHVGQGNVYPQLTSGNFFLNVIARFDNTSTLIESIEIVGNTDLDAPTLWDTNDNFNIWDNILNKPKLPIVQNYTYSWEDQDPIASVPANDMIGYNVPIQRIDGYKPAAVLEVHLDSNDFSDWPPKIQIIDPKIVFVKSVRPMDRGRTRWYLTIGFYNPTEDNAEFHFSFKILYLPIDNVQDQNFVTLDYTKSKRYDY